MSAPPQSPRHMLRCPLLTVTTRRMTSTITSTATTMRRNRSIVPTVTHLTHLLGRDCWHHAGALQQLQVRWTMGLEQKEDGEEEGEEKRQHEGGGDILLSERPRLHFVSELECRQPTFLGCGRSQKLCTIDDFGACHLEHHLGYSMRGSTRITSSPCACGAFRQQRLLSLTGAGGSMALESRFLIPFP